MFISLSEGGMVSVFISPCKGGVVSVSVPMKGRGLFSSQSIAIKILQSTVFHQCQLQVKSYIIGCFKIYLSYIIYHAPRGILEGETQIPRGVGKAQHKQVKNQENVHTAVYYENECRNFSCTVAYNFAFVVSAVVLPGLSLITSVLIFFITATVLILRLLCK